MNLNHLQTFRVVAETLSFTEAAKRMHTVQPAVSRQIRGLEDELGYRLFNRSRQSVMLTPEGLALLKKVSRAIDELDQALNPVKNEGEPRGSLSVASTPDAGILYLWPRLLQLQKSFPQIDLQFRLGSSASVFELLQKGECAFGMVTTAPTSKAYAMGPVIADPIVLVQSKQTKIKNWMERDRFDFVLYAEGDTYTAQLFRGLLPKRRRADVIVRATINSHIGMIEAVVKNDWLAALPRSSALASSLASRIEIVAESASPAGFHLICLESYLSNKTNQKIWKRMTELCAST